MSWQRIETRFMGKKEEDKRLMWINYTKQLRIQGQERLQESARSWERILTFSIIRVSSLDSHLKEMVELFQDLQEKASFIKQRLVLQFLFLILKSLEIRMLSSMEPSISIVMWVARKDQYSNKMLSNSTSLTLQLKVPSKFLKMIWRM